MSFQPVGEGMVHRLYLPAGTAVPATVKSALVSRTVASFAPVRHTWFQGTTFPNTPRPRIEGRLYRPPRGTPATLARADSGGDKGPRDRGPNDFPSAPKPRPGTRSTVTCSVLPPPPRPSP